MAMKGIDISGWQKGMSLDAVANQIDFVICKATEGTGLVDSCCDQFFQAARRLGKKVGFYHFARHASASVEAEYFYNNTKGYVGQGIPVLDWEDDQSVAWVNEFVRHYHDLTGVWPWIYANPWRFKQGAVEANCGRWVAGYPSNGITDINYGINNNLPSSYNVGSVVAWQFTSSGRLNGYGGNLDMDVFYGDAAAWDKYVNPNAVVVQPEPEPEPDPKPPLPDALKRFVDLDSEAWYVEPIETVVKNEWMNGYDGEHFGPDDSLTRGQAVCIIANYSDAEFDEPFDDVTASPFYYKAVEWAKENGIINGSNGEFRPDDPCTREELMVMLYNLAGDPEHVGQPTGFPDWASVSDWAKDAVAWCVEKAVINGSGGNIEPTRNCTRAEAAAMIVNYDKAMK